MINKIPNSMVLISLFLFLSACATKIIHSDGTVENREVDWSAIGEAITPLVDQTMQYLEPSSDGDVKSGPPASQPQQPANTQPASRTTRQSSGRTSQSNNSSNNSNQGSKKSSRSSCNTSSSNNPGTCR